MSDARVTCDVPDCRRTMGVDVYRRTFKHEPGGWVCPAHWRIVPTRMKRALSRVRRKGKRMTALIGTNPLIGREHRLWARIWREIVG